MENFVIALGRAVVFTIVFLGVFGLIFYVWGSFLSWLLRKR